MQDGDANQNQLSDVWKESWQATWRDLVVLNGENEKAFVVNLTTFDLGNSANYQELGRALVQVAIEDQRPWCNASNVLDVDQSGVVDAVDFQLVMTDLNQQGSRALPMSVVPTLRLDCDFDGHAAPLDALRILNYLSNPTASGEGEAFVERPSSSPADIPSYHLANWDQALDEIVAEDTTVATSLEAPKTLRSPPDSVPWMLALTTSRTEVPVPDFLRPGTLKAEQSNESPLELPPMVELI